MSGEYEQQTEADDVEEPNMSIPEINPSWNGDKFSVFITLHVWDPNGSSVQSVGLTAEQAAAVGRELVAVANRHNYEQHGTEGER